MGKFRLIEAHELARADKAEPPRLARGIFPFDPVIADDSTRYEDTVIWRVPENFVGIGVIPIWLALGWAAVGDEVERRVHIV
jgi:hypothetical protein